MMSRRRMMMAQSSGEVETYLCRDYSPNGSKFIYTIDGISLANGDYIEISADLTNCSHSNENVISVGDASTLGAWNGNHYHSYRNRAAAGVQYLEISCRYGSSNDSNSRYQQMPLSGNEVLYRIDKNGISYDGILLEPKAGATMYPQLISYLNSVSTISIGSQEGNTRFYGTYNYIKWVKTT